VKELYNRMKQFQATIEGDFIKFADQKNIGLGSTALAFIEKRVRRKGGGAADGSQWKPYSTKPTFITPYKKGAKSNSFTSKTKSDIVFRQLKGKRKDKILVAKDGSEKLGWFTVKGHHLALLPGGYKRIREIEGRQVAFKDFERTSEMWKSIHVMGTQSLGLKFVTTIGTENKLSKKKLEGNNKREGKEILMLSKKEEQDLQEILDKWITNRVNKAMNG